MLHKYKNIQNVLNIVIWGKKILKEIFTKENFFIQNKNFLNFFRSFDILRLFEKPEYNKIKIN